MFSGDMGCCVSMVAWSTAKGAFVIYSVVSTWYVKIRLISPVTLSKKNECVSSRKTSVQNMEK